MTEQPKKTSKQKFYKFLHGNLRCGYENKQFYYPAPTPIYDEQGNLKSWKPGAWVTELNADTTSKASCGRGLHLMKVLKPIYTRYTGNCYEAEGQTLLGEDQEKARFKKARLIRPILQNEIFKPKTNLSGADLSGANLFGADLSGADLFGVYLRKNQLTNTQLDSAVNTDKIVWID